jgi:uncharacterized membrane protein YhaH (DUF805 family)
MGFGEAIASGFRNYVGFSGRTPRSGYWYWVLFAVLVGIVTLTADFMLFGGDGFNPINNLSSLLLFLPGLAVSVRRLHDIDRSGWWLLLLFTIIGILLLLYWDCVKGTSGPNRFGPDPLAGR